MDQKKTLKNFGTIFFIKKVWKLQTQKWGGAFWIRLKPYISIPNVALVTKTHKTFFVSQFSFQILKESFYTNPLHLIITEVKLRQKILLFRSLYHQCSFKLLYHLETKKSWKVFPVLKYYIKLRIYMTVINFHSHQHSIQ